MVVIIGGIILGIFLIVLLFCLIVSRLRNKNQLSNSDEIAKKIVVNQQGVDVSSGKLGAGHILLGLEQEETICISQELLQNQQYPLKLRHIQLTEQDTGLVWKSGFSSEIFIGRTPSPEGRRTVVILYSGISKKHCRIFAEGTHYMVEDCGSTNGTYLNSEKINAPMQIQTGDILVLGKKKFEVVLQ